MGEIEPDDYTRYISALDLKKVEMFGSGYVVDYCISIFSYECKDIAYRNYVCNCLQMLTENTAKSSGGNYVNKSFYDIMHPVKLDDRPVEDIIADLIKRTGIVQRE